MKKRHWAVILIGMILMIGLIGPGQAEEQLPPEIKSALAGMEITQTAYWDHPGSTWFVLVRRPDGMNKLLCFELQDGAWVQSFYTSAAVPQGKTSVERLHITDKLRDFVDDRVLPGPILLILADDGSYTSYQRSASGQWNLLKVFWIDEQVYLDFNDESVTYITPVDQDNNKFETVEGSFERDLRKVDINAIPKSPQQAREMRSGKPSREYFESLDKESSLQDIVRDAGNYGIEGSGILRYVWPLNDGSRAKVMFDSKGRIVMIYIVGENGSERIYEREYPETGSDAGHAAESESIDLDEAVREMKQAIGEQIPAGGRLLYPDPAQPKLELFDVTGDGCADLCTCVTWGSGMVRTDLVVYDPFEKKLYILDGYNYNYLIDRVEEDRMIIVMEGPYGYNEPLVKTFGTVIIEDGRLVFVFDSEAH